MIEFTGYLTNGAAKHFAKKSRNLGLKIILAVIGLMSPVVILIAISTKAWLLLKIYATAVPALILTVFIPRSKKEQKSITPKRIYTDGESITCVADKYVETKFIDDVKEVHDYGDYYDLIFPFGKVSEKFICQKDLLSQGSLQRFEELFKNKVVKKM